jgi:hypothetical protein
MSVKVVPEPMVMAVGGVAVDEAELVRWLMERRCFCGRRPAERATMSSVPPAMGV